MYFTGPFRRIIPGLILSLILLSASGCSGAGTAAATTAATTAVATTSAESATTEDKALTEEETKADAILSRMKKEADTLYPENTPYAILDGKADTPVNKDLLDFCRALPKAGDLHSHDELFIPIDEYMKIIKEYPNVYIDLDKGDDHGKLYVDDAPNTAVLLKDALSSGRITEEEIRQSLILSEEDVPNGRWLSFSSAFNTKRNISNNEALLEKLYEAGFRSGCKNNVDLLETRVYFSEDDTANTKLCEMIRRAYYTVKKDYPDLVVRIIASCGKAKKVTPEKAKESLRSAIRINKSIMDESDPADPEPFIIGLDLVNEEDTSTPLSEYKDFFTSTEVKESGLKLFLHAGESLRMDNTSVRDAIEFGTTRLGHGFNLYRFPDLMDKCAKEKIAVEVCPISNYRLGYVSDIRLHPAYSYIRNGIPVVIASDDGLFLEAEPLVYDYYAAILSWDLNISEIKELCRNNIIYSGLSDKENDRLMSSWEKKWEEFIKKYQG